MAHYSEDRDLYERLKKIVVVVTEKTSKEKEKEEEEEALNFGTGFVVKSDGFILTSHHNQSQPTDVMYCTHVNGAEYKTEVAKQNVARDMLLLKVKSDEPLNWNAAEFSPEDDYPVGKNVFTIGHPYALNYTFLKGQLGYPYNHGFCRCMKSMRRSCDADFEMYDADLPLLEIDNMLPNREFRGDPCLIQ